MGWPAHDPEGWSACCRTGIIEWFETEHHLLPEAGTEQCDAWLNALDSFLTFLEEHESGIFSDLVQKAWEHIKDAEQDYLTAKAEGLCEEG